jgi:hypothetical protein
MQLYSRSRIRRTVAVIISNIDSIPLTSNVNEIPGSKGVEGRSFIDLLFKVENEIKDLPYEEIREKRLERSPPILDVF